VREGYRTKKNVLLVNITRLGDMIQATPTIAGIKLENPDCRITVVVERQFAKICDHIPHIDAVKPIDLSLIVQALERKGDGVIDAFEHLSSFVDELLQEQFDYCLNMSNSAYTALLIKLLEIKRIGGWVSDDEGYRRIESEWAKLFASNVFHHNRVYNTLNLVDVFRASADVELHPNNLLMNYPQHEKNYIVDLINKHNFINKGPLIAIQAGASQEKRQWSPKNFAILMRRLDHELKARIILTGTKSELGLINEITNNYNSPNILIAAGKTNIPQLAALLDNCQITITGDTGTMHISVANNTPVVAMFLASAYGFETGPYSEGNIVVQPKIICGPCNPNKSCNRPDCHELVSPDLIFELTKLRINHDIYQIDPRLVNHREVTVYRTYFDELGFYNMQPLHPIALTTDIIARDAYRLMWLKNLAGYDAVIKPVRTTISLIDDNENINVKDGIEVLIKLVKNCLSKVETLKNGILSLNHTAGYLTGLIDELSLLDRKVEEYGFFYAVLGPIAKMFNFGKENLIGTDPLDLASQMERVYRELLSRTVLFGQMYDQVAAIYNNSYKPEVMRNL
jgi:ADP-heptose:LPS heptosyltransferase